jgi:hypothetical protein
MAALQGAVFRAILGGSDLAVHIQGRTGGHKTGIAAIAQQHFGSAMDERSLPLAWSHTANALEGALSAAKDVLIVVDEYVPGESQNARAQLQTTAERVFRAIGNATGRGRMRADGTLKPARPPRGQIVSTGEEVPGGQSLRARMLAPEVRKGDVDLDRLTSAQAVAAEGIYAKAIAGFVMWMAGVRSDVMGEFQTHRRGLRDSVDASHRRTADAIAQLGAAWRIFLWYALDAEAVQEHEARQIEDRMWAGLTDLATEQALLQQAADPVERFRELVLSALGSGSGHVVMAQTGDAPHDAQTWGWREEPAGADAKPTWRAKGACIGWLDSDGSLFLDPDASYSVVSKIGGIGIAADTLSARLADRGITIVERDGQGRRNRVKRLVVGKRRRVLHVRTTEWLYPSDTGATGADGAEFKSHQQNHGVDIAPLH